jgi:hypothetical protein
LVFYYDFLILETLRSTSRKQEWVIPMYALTQAKISGGD